MWQLPKENLVGFTFNWAAFTTTAFISILYVGHATFMLCAHRKSLSMATKSACSQFQQHFKSSFCANFLLPKKNTNLSIKKLLKMLLYEKAARKMLVKLTPRLLEGLFVVGGVALVVVVGPMWGGLQRRNSNPVQEEKNIPKWLSNPLKVA